MRKAVRRGVWSWACTEGRPDTRAIQLRDLKAEIARPDGAAFNCSQLGIAPGGGSEGEKPERRQWLTQAPHSRRHMDKVDGAYLRACNSRGTFSSQSAGVAQVPDGITESGPQDNRRGPGPRGPGQPQAGSQEDMC